MAKLLLLPGAALWLFAGLAAAQAELVLQNLVPLARREGAAVVVPFAQGAVRDRPDLHVEGCATAWEPFGARWPDGSLRQALCLFPVELGALQERRLALRPGPGPTPPVPPPGPAAATVWFVVVQGDATTRLALPETAVLEQNALRRVALHHGRLGTTGLVAELLLTTWAGQAHAAADLGVWFSDPGRPELQVGIDALQVESEGLDLELRHPERLAMARTALANGTRWQLLAGRPLGDGQGLRRTGALLPRQPRGAAAAATARAAALVPVLGATDWRPSGAFGAFGLVPEPPPWLQGQSLRAHLAARHQAFVAGAKGPGDPFAWFAHGLAKNPAQTGDQYDFGVVKLSLVAHSGLPSLLYEVEPAVLQEACRPVHCFEADGSPVEPERHPDWVVWSGRTHWHAAVSPDRLGKPHPEPRFDSHGWRGKDREHWSSNHLGAFALLTGAHWARRELANEARLYLAGQTIDPQRTTSGAGAPRGAGRTALAAAWIYLATGDERLRARIDARLDQVYHPQWRGRALPPERVRAMAVAGPDARLLGGAAPFWNPWQDALAAVGFAAVHRVTGNPRARELAEGLATNVVRHGYRLTERECVIASALRWQDGEPLAAELVLGDHPAAAQWSYGTAFTEWAVGAVEIARVAAERQGDRALAERAAAIQQRVRAGRKPPGRGYPELGGIDRLTEWDAVRWE